MITAARSSAAARSVRHSSDSRRLSDMNVKILKTCISMMNEARRMAVLKVLAAPYRSTYSSVLTSTRAPFRP
jgi:hypothetical protein